MLRRDVCGLYRPWSCRLNDVALFASSMRAHLERAGLPARWWLELPKLRSTAARARARGRPAQRCSRNRSRSPSSLLWALGAAAAIVRWRLVLRAIAAEQRDDLAAAQRAWAAATQRAAAAAGTLRKHAKPLHMGG